VILELGAQPVGEVRVDLDGDHPPGHPGQSVRQDTQARADLQHLGAVVQPGRTHDGGGNPLVVQERLRQALARPQAQGA
jgi:hypothetical protein